MMMMMMIINVFC